MSPESTSRVRRRIAAGSMIAGPALLVAGTLVTPATNTAPAAYLSDVAEHAGRVQAGALLFVLGHMLLVPAIFAMMHVVTRTVPRLGHVAGALAVSGSFAMAGLGTTRLYDLALARALTPAQGAEAVDELQQITGFLVVLVLPAVAGLTLGAVLLGVALWRSGLAAWWLPVVMLLGFVGVSIGGDGTSIGVAGSAMLASALGLVGYRIGSMSDREWRIRGDETLAEAADRPVGAAT